MIFANRPRNDVMNIERSPVLFGCLAAVLAYLIALPDFIGAGVPEGRSVEVNAVRSAIVVYLLCSVPSYFAFARAKAAAVASACISTNLANGQGVALALRKDLSNLLGIPLWNIKAAKMFAQRFWMNIETISYLTDAHLFVPVEVIEKRPKLGIRGNTPFGCPIALARTILDSLIPHFHGVGRVLVEDFAALGARFAQLLHLDTSEKEASRFGQSAGVKRADAKRDVKGLYPGTRGLLFGRALDDLSIAQVC